MRRVFATILTGAVLCASACTTAVDGTPVADPKARQRPTPSGPVTLTIMTSGEMGYEDLLADYQRDHEDVTVRIEKVDPGAYYPKLRSMLAAGSAPDIVVVGEEYSAVLFAEPDQFADLAEVGPDVDRERWLPWKYEGGLAKDGTLVGYGVDIAPIGMAYRTDLFAGAGLPTDPAQVGDLFTTWDSYFAAGDQYVAATGLPWFDSSAVLYTAMQNQLETGYFDDADQLVIETNKDIKANWDLVTGAAGRGQSAKFEPFSPDLFSGLRSGAFATVAAPYWMLGVIKANSGPETAGKWAVANAFPGGSANWGGSYLSVPSQSANPEQAAELAAWLTAPEQLLKMFATTNTLPSQVEALESDELRGTTDDFFATAGTGKLYADLAGQVKVAPYPAPLDTRVQNEAMWPALHAVELGTPPDAGWQQAVDKAKQVS